MGEIDLARIEVVGERIADHVRIYKMARNVGSQLKWMEPLAPEEQLNW